MGDDKPTISNVDALIAAIQAHDLTALEKAIVRCGAEPRVLDKPDASGITPLLWAVRSGQADAVQRLLAAGADPNIGLREDYSPLPLSIILREYAIAAELMLSPVIDLDRFGFVAATEAVINRDTAGLQCLAVNGFDFRRKVPPESKIMTDHNRATSLLFFSISTATPLSDIVQCLLAQGADPDAMSDGSTLLTKLCGKTNDYPGPLKTLLEAGAKPERLDGCGYSALHYVSANDHAESAKLLLAFGAPADQPARDGTFPLLWAASNHGRAVHTQLIEAFGATERSFAKKAVEHLSRAWYWNPGGSTWGALELAAGDGAWHGLAWGHSADEVIDKLACKFASSRGRTQPLLVVRMCHAPEKAVAPAPWLCPGCSGKYRPGQKMALTYFAPSFGMGIPRAWPADLVYRFILSNPPAGEQNLQNQPGMVAVEIRQILTFEEGWRSDLPEVTSRFNGQGWVLGMQ